MARITQGGESRFRAPRLGHPLWPAHGLGLQLELELGLGLAVRLGLGRPLGLARLGRLLALELEQYNFVCLR